jgi:hypothetical protein
LAASEAATSSCSEVGSGAPQPNRRDERPGRPVVPARTAGAPRAAVIREAKCMAGEIGRSICVNICCSASSILRFKTGFRPRLYIVFRHRHQSPCDVLLGVFGKVRFPNHLSLVHLILSTSPIGLWQWSEWPPAKTQVRVFGGASVATIHFDCISRIMSPALLAARDTKGTRSDHGPGHEADRGPFCCGGNHNLLPGEKAFLAPVTVQVVFIVSFIVSGLVLPGKSVRFNHGLPDSATSWRPRIYCRPPHVPQAQGEKGI